MVALNYGNYDCKDSKRWFRTSSVTQQLHSPVVSHSSLSHPQSATLQAVVSSIVSESFYWTAMVLLEALSLILCPKIACITYRVHETVLGRNSQSLNREDHHLVSQSNSKACVYRLAKANSSLQNVHNRLNV